MYSCYVINLLFMRSGLLITYTCLCMYVSMHSFLLFMYMLISCCPRFLLLKNGQILCPCGVRVPYPYPCLLVCHVSDSCPTPIEYIRAGGV